jgi:GT2 family glycosyltransferase
MLFAGSLGEPTGARCAREWLVAPRVGIVVVNYLGDHLTLRCLEALHQLTWPPSALAIALVDNGSLPAFAAEVASRFPDVRVMRPTRNVGFGAACNLGFDLLADCEFIALLNNDAIPEKGWLEPLVAQFQRDPSVGAVTPKVLLDGRFMTLQLRSRVKKAGPTDPRPLGVQLCGARVGGTDVSPSIDLDRGFWGWEHDATTIRGRFAWTSGDAVFHVPASARSPGESLELRLACGLGPTTVELVEGAHVAAVSIGVEPRWVEVPWKGEPRNLINNTGTVLHGDASTSDRGYREPDDARYRQPTEVFGWSGAAVLLSRRFLDDVGGFEPSYFLYYEDADLSWRGRLRGWTYWYEPSAVVWHLHSATVGATSPIVRHLTHRNRLLMIVRCAPPDLVRAALDGEARRLWSTTRQDLVERLRRRQRPMFEHLVDHFRVLGGLVVRLPSAVLARRRIRTSATRTDDDVLRWAQPTQDRPPCRGGTND